MHFYLLHIGSQSEQNNNLGTDMRLELTDGEDVWAVFMKTHRSATTICANIIFAI